MDDVKEVPQGQNDVKETAVVEDSPATPSVEEPKATEKVETPTEETDSTEKVETVEEPTETVESEKKGLSKRVRELNARTKKAEQKAQSLAQRLEEITGSVEPQGQSYTPQVKPGSEVSADQYKQDVMRAADGLVSLRLKQQTALTKINSEALQAIKAYPELDPDSESFDKELSDTVTDAIEAHVKANPYTASVKQFADRLMKPYKRSVTKQVGQAKEALAKQVSQTALRPAQVKASEKTASEKSIQELEAELGIVNA